MLDRSILNGVYDLHIHTGPSVAKRMLDAGEMMKCAMDAGYAGYLVKDHYAPSTHGCLVVEKNIGDGSCKALSSIALNNCVGGLNLLALDVVYNMGTRMVYMPTVSSLFHIEGHNMQVCVCAPLLRLSATLYSPAVSEASGVSRTYAHTRPPDAGIFLL